MTRYLDRQGRVLFVNPANGGSWGVFYRMPNGSLRRVKNEQLPVCGTEDAAQRCLDGWAKARKLRVAP